MDRIDSIYIHYPFCKTKCHYCNFYSVPYSNKLSKKYIKSIEEEIKLYSSKYNLNDIQTIYIGGGNPGLKIGEIEIIYKIIKSNIKLRNIKEFTIESNPINVNKKLIKTLRKIKCNRVSLGIQSFNKKVLLYCNRLKQDLKKINRALELLDKNDFNISIDLINGLPLTDYKYELNELNKILKRYKNIMHISFYDLSIERGSGFYNNKNIKYLNEKITSVYEKKFKKIVKEYNFKIYEVSNYAKEKKYSLHNLNYWKYKNYLGLGPSAHSKINTLKIENKSEIFNYINKEDFKKEYNLSKKESIEEYIVMGLRLYSGLDLEDFYKKYKIKFIDLFKKNIEKYKSIKMIKINKHNIRITNRGMNILNKILTDFFIELDSIYMK